jgi:class 3 adenylate cyclase
MTDLKSISNATEQNLLIALLDLTSFGQFIRNNSDKYVFDFLSSYFEFVGDIIIAAGGTVVEFVGDSGLFAFPEDAVDAGIMALLEVKISGDRWLKEHNSPCRNMIKAHFGSVVCGYRGTREDKRFALVGDTVITTVTLDTRSFAISAQAFRKLKPETRKLFKKHTPPITYIPVGERHPD